MRNLPFFSQKSACEEIREPVFLFFLLDTLGFEGRGCTSNSQRVPILGGWAKLMCATKSLFYGFVRKNTWCTPAPGVRGIYSLGDIDVV